jgi:hypothetical protein
MPASGWSSANVVTGKFKAAIKNKAISSLVRIILLASSCWLSLPFYAKQAVHASAVLASFCTITIEFCVLL